MSASSLRHLWCRACRATGEDIGLYAGLKHSSASQLINEYGFNLGDVKMALDCSDGTVKHYAVAEVSARAAILNRHKSGRKASVG